MTFAREKDGERRARLETSGETDIPTPNAGRRKKRQDNAEIGTALRSVYQRTIDEKVPDDLLDLLGKLG